MKHLPIAISVLLGSLFAFAACESSDNGTGPGVSLDATIGIDAPKPENDASVDDVVATDTAPADVKVPPVCIDAGTTDAGCLVALPLFNTGVDGAGVSLAGGSIDPHYTLIQSAETTLPGPNAIVTSQIADGYWVAQSANSKWIAPSANQSYPGATPCNAAGKYVYRTTFSLAGLDPTTAKITGSWAADNSGTAVLLNGVSLGITAGSYSPLSPFTISTGFVAGTNTLDFEVTDIGCPNGLRVEMSGTAAPLP